MAPLTTLIDDLTRRNADKSAAAAMWQTRAAHLENQLKQLSAGTTDLDTEVVGRLEEQCGMIEDGAAVRLLDDIWYDARIRILPGA